MPRSAFRTLAFVAVVCLGASFAVAAKPPSKAGPGFVKDIQPLLAKHCGACHGAKQQESGLRLDSIAAIVAGGYSGPAIVPGNSDESFLIQVVRGVGDLKAMPPEGKKLTAAEINLLAKWVANISPSPPAPLPAAAGRGEPNTETVKKSDHWSFQPLAKVPPPPVQNEAWVRNPIDRFVLAKLEAAGLAPSPEADRPTLIRRLSLDLIGLPPSPAEVDAFVFDNAPDAYEKLVERLLASPHYGERWGRHWLDVARYADSNGYTIDSARSIWKYRDWVIDALNRDMPFDEFTIEQLAGDMLPGATLEQRIATGFHRNTLVNEEGGADKEQFRVEAVVDRVSTVGTVWLGLSVGCARCHDHKYDPISQREFYQLFALLNNCEEPSLTFPSNHQSKELPPLEAAIAAAKKRLAEARESSPGRQFGWEKQIREQYEMLQAAGDAPELLAVFDDLIQALNVPPEKRTDEQRLFVEGKFRKFDVERVGLETYLAELNAKLKQLKSKVTSTLVVKEMPRPRESYIHIRGDFLRKGVGVEPDTLAVLPPLRHDADRATRLDLARWLVEANNPLTPRVTVNRIWQQYFNAGLVATENDFGTQGELPTHPELLDWLAANFVQGRGDRGEGSGSDAAAHPSPLASRPWSFKALHRVIVSSAAYRQSSAVRPELAANDPYNKLLGRQARVRLEAEVIRDCGLAASGLLAPEVGGPSVYPPQPAGIYDFTQNKKFWPETTGDDRYRRGMYTYFWRSSPYPFLMTFDAPDANATCTRRVRSNTPLQALTLANDRSFVEMAEALADRVLREAPPSDAERAAYAFRLCLARDPRSVEVERLLAFVKSQRRQTSADDHPTWTAAARVLLNLDEFVTRE